MSIRLALKKEQVVPILAIAIVYLLFAAVLFFLVVPGFRQMKSVNRRLEQETATHTSLQTVIATKPGLEDRLHVIKGVIREQEEQIPTRSDVPLVLDYLKSVALSLQLNLSNLNYVPSSDDKNTVHIGGTLDGNHDSFLTFVQILEHTLPTAVIKKLTVDTNSKRQVYSDIYVDLYLRGASSNHQATRWVVPKFSAVETKEVRNFWGVPMDVLESFLGDQVKVEGVVIVDQEGRALVNSDGRRNWVTKGSPVGAGVIQSIDSHGVVVNVGGIEISLPVGGK